MRRHTQSHHQVVRLINCTLLPTEMLKRTKSLRWMIWKSEGFIDSFSSPELDFKFLFFFFLLYINLFFCQRGDLFKELNNGHFDSPPYWIGLLAHFHSSSLTSSLIPEPFTVPNPMVAIYFLYMCTVYKFVYKFGFFDYIGTVHNSKSNIRSS